MQKHFSKLGWKSISLVLSNPMTPGCNYGQLMESSLYISDGTGNARRPAESSWPYLALKLTSWRSCACFPNVDWPIEIGNAIHSMSGPPVLDTGVQAFICDSGGRDVRFMYIFSSSTILQWSAPHSLRQRCFLKKHSCFWLSSTTRSHFRLLSWLVNSRNRQASPRRWDVQRAPFLSRPRIVARTSTACKML